MSQGMRMPGGWTLSMMWMSMPGQGRLDAAACFVVMWIVMMVAMMLPALFPALTSYRREVRETRALGGLTTLAAVGYFSLWGVLGAGVYLIGMIVTAAEMRSTARAGRAPVATAVVVLLAGALQFTRWKARQLERCREGLACAGRASPDWWKTYRQGVHFGVHCAFCCLGFMLVLVSTGVMELTTTTVLGMAITAERLAPRPRVASRGMGAVLLGAGVLLLARTAGL
jgi:predicted metal-binding membrane protein